MAHIAVRNRTKEPQALTWDGKTIDFKPEETRIIDSVPIGHVESRFVARHKTQVVTVDGQKRVERLPHVEGVKLFEIIPLADALKAGVKPDEDPAVEALRRKENEAEQAEKALTDRIMGRLKAEGWTPPKADPLQKDKK